MKRFLNMQDLCVGRSPRGTLVDKRLSLPLSGIRKAVGKTQANVAERCQATQGEVSRIENQKDMLLSTLYAYANALGAQVEIAFIFPDRSICLEAPSEVITRFGKK